MTKKPFQQKRPSEKEENKGEKKSPKFPIWIYVVLFLVLIGFNLYFIPGESSERIKYSEFLTYVQNGYISEITITNNVEVEGCILKRLLKKELLNVRNPVKIGGTVLKRARKDLRLPCSKVMKFGHFLMQTMLFTMCELKRIGSVEFSSG